MSSSQKFTAAVLLFVLWGVFVYLGKAPVDQFIGTIRDALVALGIFHVTLVNPKG